MKKLWTTFVVAGLLASFCLSANAHFLFLRTKTVDGEQRVELMFSETAEPDDPDLLDRVSDVKVWSRDGKDKFAESSLQKRGDLLVMPATTSNVYGLTRQYGVLERGGELFLLHYHAKTLTSPLPADWQSIDDEERLPLEITPASKNGQIELIVAWKGKPVADSQIVVGGCGIDKLEGKTDSAGKFTCQPKSAGVLVVRAKHVEPRAGKLDDKPYESISHWTTLTVPVPPYSVQTSDHQLPPLEKGVTSFGAAVLGDQLYVYGGQWGGAHHYWKQGQSNELLRLSLHDGANWESLANGPRRTGTALVAYRDKLYRVGGFEARNAEADEADLHSMPDFACFDPASGQWHDLPDMPTPRSSHDAVISGDTLYVVGGWNLQQQGEGAFLETMVSIDLSAEKPQWETAKVPLKRRALSAAVHNGKLYVVGGMREHDGPSTEVDVYDLSSRQWSKGPAIHGQPMEGFGTTSFEVGGKLTAISCSGAIQQLSSDGTTWNLVGEIKHPRFFARLLSISLNRGVIVGGASMGSGKTTALEIIGDRQ